MIKYYKERESGDYLCVDASTLSYFLENFSHNACEGRSTCIEGNPHSICTCSMDVDYLKDNCVRVKRSQVPKDYLEMF